MMLKLMQPYFNLTDDQCDVFKQGYKRGNGCAPSRKIERVVEHKFQHGIRNHAITDFFHLWTQRPAQSAWEEIKDTSAHML